MELLLSPIFIGLSIISLAITGFHLWGLARACKRHNTSPIGYLSQEKAGFPNGTMIIGASLYVLLTLAYFLVPIFLHH